MPNNRLDPTMYVGTGTSIETMNQTTLYRPGELGSQIQVGGKAYQLTQLDSGATAATGAGLPLSGQLAYWKDKPNYIVTNDAAQVGGSSLSRNRVAGVFNSISSGVSGTASITPGRFGVVQQRGAHSGVFTAGNSVTVGLALIGESTTTANAISVAAGTAPGAPVVGVSTAANGAVTATYTPATLGGFDLVDVP